MPWEEFLKVVYITGSPLFPLVLTWNQKILANISQPFIFYQSLRDFLLPVKSSHASKIAIHFQNVSNSQNNLIFLQVLTQQTIKNICDDKKYLTLKKAAVEPPCTAPYFIFCCLKSWNISLYWCKNSNLYTSLHFHIIMVLKRQSERVVGGGLKSRRLVFWTHQRNSRNVTGVFSFYAADNR